LKAISSAAYEDSNSYETARTSLELQVTSASQRRPCHSSDLASCQPTIVQHTQWSVVLISVVVTIASCGKAQQQQQQHRAVDKQAVVGRHVDGIMLPYYGLATLPQNLDFFEVELRTPTGQALPRVQFDGQECFVGEPGQEFTVAVSMANHSFKDYKVSGTAQQCADGSHGGLCCSSCMQFCI
jgi:hypothetical protein